MATARFSLFGLAGVLVQSLIVSAQPTPPAGFEWQDFPQVKARVLRVTGWNFSIDETPAGWTYTNSRPVEVGSDGVFILAVVRPKKGHQGPAARARVLLSESTSKFEDIQVGKVNEGMFVKLSATCLNNGNPYSPRRVALTVLVNPHTGTGYVSQFSSPSKSWDEQRRIGQVIIDNLELNHDF